MLWRCSLRIYKRRNGSILFSVLFVHLQVVQWHLLEDLHPCMYWLLSIGVFKWWHFAATLVPLPLLCSVCNHLSSTTFLVLNFTSIFLMSRIWWSKGLHDHICELHYFIRASPLIQRWLILAYHQVILALSVFNIFRPNHSAKSILVLELDDVWFWIAIYIIESCQVNLVWMLRRARRVLPARPVLLIALLQLAHHFAFLIVLLLVVLFPAIVVIHSSIKYSIK